MDNLKVCKDCKETQCAEWVKDRPEVIRKMIDKVFPCKPVINAPTGQIGAVYSYSEKGTATVIFLAKDNKHWQGGEDRKVFGIPIKDLKNQTGS